MDQAIEWFKTVVRKYAVFEGRARRAEFWYYTLIYTLLSIACAVVDGFIGARSGMGILQALLTLALFIPTLAVTVRRLHDTDRSGWWFLISFVPVIGFIVLLIFMVLPGTSGANRFGPDPIAGTLIPAV